MREVIRQHYLSAETDVLRALVQTAELSNADRAAITQAAIALIKRVRTEGKVGMMEAFLAEYGLSTDEGVALMCLAEAMLRVPDTETVDELIRDKITPHNWAAHVGDSGSILVNASTWGLMLTGRLLDEEGEGVVGTLHGLVRRLGEPVIRKAVGQAMAEMGSQFVLGRTIDEALKNGAQHVEQGYTYSFDMLGEAARTDADALRYHRAYAAAIAAIAGAATSDDIRANPGISVKLSALHPRYEQSQRKSMLPVMCERLLLLARQAKEAGIGLNIDAEEADRLDLSLDVIEPVLADPSLAGWDGFGVVVQAFGRRALPVLEHLYSLAEGLDRRIMVRLVKGAYWDTEVKRAQVLGLDDYPVFTRKAHTDISYLAGARRLLQMQDRVYPQFATHNAQSVAAILHMAGEDRAGFEFQRLHGMGDALHEIVRASEGTRCRIYAPVGAHRDLLAYLVRRLLENGANSSFVNQIVDLSVPPEDIAADPIAEAEATAFAPNQAISRPVDLFAPRQNSRGWDITDPLVLEKIEAGKAPFRSPHQWSVSAPAAVARAGEAAVVRNPADKTDVVGHVVNADPSIVDEAIAQARGAQPRWAAKGAADRAAVLRRVADLYEENAFEIFTLVEREAGKTLLDAIAELREAVDFLRFYADEAERLEGQGPARGVILCISPWNFPLAIFAGQIAAALAAGNAVLAKPAEQTPLIAARAIAWMHEAGVPQTVLQFLPGDGADVGAALTRSPDIGGVCFTGSTEVAKIIDRQSAQTAPGAMLIAETGGLNAMVVDSTALLEQATQDIIRAAFQSAGQRCSALRMLYVQEDIEDELLAMLFGAMDALVLGNPADIATDVGPVIDDEACQAIQAHVETARSEGRLLKQMEPQGDGFVPPSVIQVSGIADIRREVFGPVLHVARFDGEDIEQIIDQINATGYGLTFGLHTRIDARVQGVLDQIRVGNAYVNRDQIGAIVGSQPFGGHGLSGTGPKAGGPNYVERFLQSPNVIEAHASSGGVLGGVDVLSEMAKANDRLPVPQAERVAALRAALRGQAKEAMAAAAAIDMGTVDLPGPTGEANQLELQPRGTVLCLGPSAETLLAQTVQALALGNHAVAIAPDAGKTLHALRSVPLPLTVLDGTLPPDEVLDLPCNLVAYMGNPTKWRAALAAREGPIVGLVNAVIAPEAYCTERSICIDTTAAGGNASLLAEADP